MKLPVFIIPLVLLTLPAITGSAQGQAGGGGAPALELSPSGQTLFWGEEPVEELSHTRARRCLNGLWQFTPASSREAPLEGWGTIWVPGAWSTVLKKMPGVEQAGTGKAWKNFNANNRSKGAAEINAAWYRREIVVPDGWEGRRLFVELDRVCTDAEVFIDGQKAGFVGWPGGEVEITGLAEAGQPAMLDLRVVAALDKTEVTEYMGDAGNLTFTKKIDLDNRGLTGDVFLVSRKPGPFIEDVFVQPSTREKRLRVSFALAGGDLPELVRVHAECVNEDGVVENEYEELITLGDIDPAEIEIAFDWEDPALWDFLQPNLYTLRLSVSGEGVDDEITQVFGFREFWIEGRKFMLNGKEFRLRPRNSARNWHDREVVSIERMDGAIDGMISLGGNIQEFWPWDHYVRGTTRMLDLWCERADLKGWPVIAPVGSVREFVNRWDSADEERAEWLRLTDREIKRLRNHPSVLMWIHSPNRLPLRYDQDPTVLGNRERLTPREDTNYMNLLDGAHQANDAIRALDPTRPVTFHHGAAAGDYHSINNYLSWMPLQEQEEWLSRYMAMGDMPYMPVEFGFVAHMDGRRGRNGWKGATQSESLMTEFAASYLGPDAYRQEDAALREVNPKYFKKGQEYRSFYPPESTLDNQIAARFAQRVYLGWRTMNAPASPLYWHLDYFWEKPVQGPKTQPQQVSGPFEPGRRGAYVPELTPYERYGMSEMAMDPTPASEAMANAFAPTVAWICAPQSDGDIAAFTAKDHHFVAGEKIEKAIALLNDTREAQPYHFTWTAYLAGKTVGSGSGDGVIEPSHTEILPLVFTAPSIDRETQDGVIELTATMGGEELTDCFDFRLYRDEAQANEVLMVFDPMGKSSTMLKEMGYSLEDWNGQPRPGTLVIGREAFTSGVPMPGDINAFARAGGRVVVLQQQPDWLEQSAGFRTGAFVERRVFPIPGAAEWLGDIDADDLRDWSGHSSLLPVIGDDQPQSSTSYPVHGWHWSNRGGVSSAPVEKPHAGNWTPLLETGFGSLYSPLMLMREGAGEVILCQLDLEDHAGVDPAARKLAHKILSHPRPTQPSDVAGQTCYSGSGRWAALLAAMGLDYERIDGQDIPAGCGLLIIAPESKISAERVEAFAAAGGRVFSLPGSPLEGKTQATPAYSGSAEVPDWSECAGLSVGDLHVRAPVALELLVPDAGSGIEIGANGLLARERIDKGVIVFSRFDPDMYQADTKTYLRITRWRSYRIIAQLLSNLGARFANRGQLFNVSADMSGRPPEALSLAGTWDAMRTYTLPAGASSRTRKAEDPGLSEEARRIIRSGRMLDGEEVILPAFQESLGEAWSTFDGESVFQRSVSIPSQWQGCDLVLELGKVDDYDNVYFNGVEIGKTGSEHEAPWGYDRRYVIPGKLVRAGENVLTVRVFDNYQNGGVLGNHGDILLRLNTVENKQLFDGWYSTDYRNDFPLGDDPYRYYRW
ncbi:MAG: glycoside hydrolase family 2 TIM barrel-domain containing protein [Verrucomicrobiota bacterium JB024]|nr:glycoside hydrolase family 2 TIM barrel-domain containing protein [Verrucomicrobiota bacterium JB024]